MSALARGLPSTRLAGFEHANQIKGRATDFDRINRRPAARANERYQRRAAA
jgi:hypothetical protein